MSWLITPAQLEKFRKNQKSLIILDASLHLPQSGRHGKKEFLEKHIIDSQFFDITALSDPQSPLPYTLTRDEARINQVLGSLGIRNDYKIIFYDNSELHSACRALWMFKVFGHNPHQLYILDGGLAAWEKFGGKVEYHEAQTSPKNYTAEFQPELIRTLAQMKSNLMSQREQVIDLRHPVRFTGGTETRIGLRKGHIPHSISFPYFAFFDKEGFFVPLENIKKRFTDVCINLNEPMIATCGSAITASILDFVLDLMGHKDHAVYDGSWAEWGAEDLYPGEASLDERPVRTSI